MKYAIDGKYPIETKDQLEKTAAYFDKFLPRFHPKDRIKIASTMEKRAEELGVNLTRDWITNYSRPLRGTATVSPDFERNIEMRKQACAGKTLTISGQPVKAEVLLEKIATSINEHGTFVIVDELFSFDKLAGLEYQWDKSIVDPVMTVFGSLSNPEYDAVKIFDNITNYGIKKLAVMGGEVARVLTQRLGKDTTKAFLRDPEEAMHKLNDDQKTVARDVLHHYGM